MQLVEFLINVLFLDNSVYSTVFIILIWLLLFFAQIQLLNYRFDEKKLKSWITGLVIHISFSVFKAIQKCIVFTWVQIIYSNCYKPQLVCQNGSRCIKILYKWVLDEHVCSIHVFFMNTIKSKSFQNQSLKAFRVIVDRKFVALLERKAKFFFL